MDFTSASRQAKYRQRLRESGLKRVEVYLDQETYNTLDALVNVKMSEGKGKQESLNEIIKTLINPKQPPVFDEAKIRAIIQEKKNEGKSAREIAEILNTQNFCDKKGKCFNKDKVIYLQKIITERLINEEK
jgi:hypothetical protein